MSEALDRRLVDGLRDEIDASLTDAEAYALLYDWHYWARPNQLEPPGDWSYWAIIAGRGYGKTRVLSEYLRRYGPVTQYLNIIGATADDARDILVQGESGVLAVCPTNERPHYSPSKRRLEWPSGSWSLIFTADEPERLRGKQHSGLVCDEVAAWRYPESWDQAMFGLRLGKHPRAVVATTPRPIKLIKDLLSNPACAVTRGTTFENKANLAPSFFTEIIRKYEGTRLGRQELMAEVLDDVPGALWTIGGLDRNRISREKLPPLTRIVVGVDPSGSSGEGGTETGIVICGRDAQGHGYCLEDETLIGTPNEWAEVAVRAYRESRAERVVAEVNFGGEMVEATVRTVDRNVSYKAVRASRGKIARAEPVAALDEQGRTHMVGSFPKLEDELCTYVAASGQKSPNRLDAYVWAMTELLLGEEFELMIGRARA